MVEIDKQLIKERFAKSIDTYNAHAISQKQIAETLIKYIQKHSEDKFNKVLELGAGTGFLTNELLNAFSINELECNDMVGEYKTILQEQANKHNTNFNFIECDLEQTNNFKNKYSLIASASALQWIVELDHLFKNLSDKIESNGMLAFSTFGKKNLIEFRSILSQGLFYPNLQMLKDTVGKYFTVCHYYEEEIIMHFKTPTDVLKHIKYTGVNSLIRSTMTRKKLNAFSDEYTQKYTSEKGVRLTYNPIYIIAKKL